MQGKNGAARIIDESTVTQTATEYLVATLGAAFSIHSLYASSVGSNWWVRIQYQLPESDGLVTVGSLQIDGLSGEVIPLTLSQINELQERAALLVAHRRQELARDQRGYILPSQAKVKAIGYVAEHIAFFATAEEQPQWIEGRPPFWRVATALRLQGQGKVCDLGVVDVNALTGEVLTLTEKEIITRQNRARHAAEAVTPSAAATG